MTRLVQNYLTLLEAIPTFVEADKKLLRSRKQQSENDLSEAMKLDYMTQLSTLTTIRQTIEYFYFQHIYVSYKKAT